MSDRVLADNAIVSADKAIALTNNAIALTNNAIASANNVIASTNNAIALTNNAIALTNNAIDLSRRDESRLYNLGFVAHSELYCRKICPHPPTPSFNIGRRGANFKVPLPSLGEGFRVKAH
ncbi:MAG: hypothetical protein RMZ42_05850 [Nostoc sp. DedQUE05]|uniref:hypothetical protein n=1 Tax=Nostoc sp. DedQUE05 TaxID=3075391 RepID=UPI002AD49712|nr:hypothetical protein [Nostoc sp. DedQUE05]MDZ8091450.1 hypothetical protein [Nostoc sp. DedQUE05]